MQLSFSPDQGKKLGTAPESMELYRLADNWKWGNQILVTDIMLCCTLMPLMYVTYLSSLVSQRVRERDRKMIMRITGIIKLFYNICKQVETGGKMGVLHSNILGYFCGWLCYTFPNRLNGLPMYTDMYTENPALMCYHGFQMICIVYTDLLLEGHFRNSNHKMDLIAVKLLKSCTMF